MMQQLRTFTKKFPNLMVFDLVLMTQAAADGRHLRLSKKGSFAYERTNIPMIT